MFRILLLATLVFCLMAAGSSVFGYSVLTHQAIIDSCWDKGILPLLKKRFPKATTEQLREAHSYSYGGSIIQDSGYYPLGSKFFTNLLHYVRSGDFIECVLTESRDLNEYAFALGALAHYAADNSGHPLGVNPSVPLVYPKLRLKYGPVVTYAESPSAHLKMEFAFDVLQVARGQYAPQSYRDFIGFQVSKPLLERAFRTVYCLELKDLFASLDLALGTYRRSVSTIIPEMTKVAWQAKKSDIEKVMPGITREKFVYMLPRADYEKDWGREYEKPGSFARFLAWVFRVLPKIGFMKALAFKIPTPEAEKMFLGSFDTTVTRYREFLAQAGRGHLDLRNMDFDTGKPTRAGEYELCDKTYGEFLAKLADRKFKGVSHEVRADLLRFYADPTAPIETKKNRKEWRKTLAALQQLKAAQ